MYVEEREEERERLTAAREGYRSDDKLLEKKEDGRVYRERIDKERTTMTETRKHIQIESEYEGVRSEPRRDRKKGKEKGVERNK